MEADMKTTKTAHPPYPWTNAEVDAWTPERKWREMQAIAAMRNAAARARYGELTGAVGVRGIVEQAAKEGMS
jgi:hypothetical protein